MITTYFLAGGLIFFFAANLYKFFFFLRMPEHLRREMAPLPAGRSFDLLTFRKNRIPGGSPSMGYGKSVGVFTDLLLLAELRDYNRSIWRWSIILHWGLYAAMILACCIGMEAVVDIAGISRRLWIHPFIAVLLWIASALTTAGCAGLLRMRLVDPLFRKYSHPEDYLNLGVLFLLSTSALLSLATFPDTPSLILASAEAVFTFTAVPATNIPLAAALFYFILFLFYYPFSTMTHLYTKWLTRPNDPHRLVEFEEKNKNRLKLDAILHDSGGRMRGNKGNQGEKWEGEKLEDPSVADEKRSNGGRSKNGKNGHRNGTGEGG